LNSAGILFAFVLILQALAYTDTCSQGGSDGFNAGLIFGAPFLLGCLWFAARGLRRSEKAVMAGVAADGQVGSVFLLFLTAVALAMNARTAMRVFAGGSPCGADYDAYVDGIEPLNVLVGAGLWHGPCGPLGHGGVSPMDHAKVVGLMGRRITLRRSSRSVQSGPISFFSCEPKRQFCVAAVIPYPSRTCDAPIIPG
jgi:hypothetical protein